MDDVVRGYEFAQFYRVTANFDIALSTMLNKRNRVPDLGGVLDDDTNPAEWALSFAESMTGNSVLGFAAGSEQTMGIISELHRLD